MLNQALDEEESAMEAYVPQIVMSYTELFASHFTQPSFKYFSSYLVSLFITRGRKTMSRVAHTCFFIERHLSSWERFLSQNKWDLNAVLRTLVETVITQMGEALQVHGAYLIGLDPTLIAKNGTQMPGVQRWKDHSGNADRGPTIRGHHWAVAGLLGFSAAWGGYICFPLLMRMISGQLNPCQIVVNPQGVANVANFWECVHPLIWQLHALFDHAPLRVVADAYFSKAPFVNPLVEAGIDVISRLRKDAVGWDDPTPDQRSDAKRGKKWKLAHLVDHFTPQTWNVWLYGEQRQVRAVSRILQLRNFKRKVKVVILADIQKPVLLLSTDLTLTAAQIIEIYGARYRIELAIRGLKQHFGLADYQCYLATAIQRFVHLACVAFCIFRLIQLREDTEGRLPLNSDDSAPASFTPLRHAIQRHMLQQILAPKFGKTADLEDSSPALEAIMHLVG
jgi:hypothetical protein